MSVTATFIYSGLSDYWGGNGRRWDDNAGCLFSYYGVGTTLREIVDGWVDDFNMGGDCDSLPEEVTDSDIRAALLDMLSPVGREDYDNDVVAECATEYAEINGLDTCKDCGEKIKDFHDPLCTEGNGFVEDCDCEEDDFESPVCIVLIEYEAPEDEWILCQYDDPHENPNLSGKWCWTNGEEDTVAYDSEEIAFQNRPKENTDGNSRID